MSENMILDDAQSPLPKTKVIRKTGTRAARVRRTTTTRASARAVVSLLSPEMDEQHRLSNWCAQPPPSLLRNNGVELVVMQEVWRGRKDEMETYRAAGVTRKMVCGHVKYLFEWVGVYPLVGSPVARGE